MDLSAISPILMFIGSTLLAINAFFLRNLVVELKSASKTTIENSVKIEMIQKQMESISRMREDVAGLKVAILGHLKKMDGNS